MAIKIVEIVYFAACTLALICVSEFDYTKWPMYFTLSHATARAREAEKCMRAAADKIEEVGHNLTHGARRGMNLCARLGTFCYLFLTRQRRLEIAAYMRVINNCGLCEMVTAFLIPTT